MGTSFVSSSDVDRKWILVDADGLVLGRMAVILANILRGKDKIFFSPNADCGDYVVVINAEKVALTGKKLDNKSFFWHTGYPGGIKQRTMRQMVSGDHPERVVYNAVRRMLSKGPLSRDILLKLRVYKGENHPHVAQGPIFLDIKKLNSKNSRSMEA